MSEMAWIAQLWVSDGYQAAAAHARAERSLEAAPDGDLARVVLSPTLGNAHTVEERPRGLIADSFARAGEISLVRGLLPGVRRRADR